MKQSNWTVQLSLQLEYSERGKAAMLVTEVIYTFPLKHFVRMWPHMIQHRDSWAVRRSCEIHVLTCWRVPQCSENKMPLKDVIIIIFLNPCVWQGWRLERWAWCSPTPWHWWETSSGRWGKVPKWRTWWELSDAWTHAWLKSQKWERTSPLFRWRQWSGWWSIQSWKAKHPGRHRRAPLLIGQTKVWWPLTTWTSPTVTAARWCSETSTPPSNPMRRWEVLVCTKPQPACQLAQCTIMSLCVSPA